MILISASGLGRQYAGDPIFLDLAFEIRAGERIGLVGPNGAGKTTLMKLLDGIESPEYGQIHVRPGIRISLLSQHPEFGPDETLMDVARSGLGSLLDLQRELEEAAQEMAESEDQGDRDRASRRYDELHERLIHQDAYSIDHRVEEILCGLRFAEADFHRPARTFSGGQQSRLMLAKLLLESPDLMLLDEPSNHLDIETTEWLENYLSRQPVAMLVVSHDRYFLDKVVTRTWELYEGKLEVYPGNYSQYWKLRTEKAKVLERQAERQEEKAEKLEAYIRKYGAGQRAKQAHDRERKLEKLQGERVDTMREIVGPVMGFEEVDRSGDIVIEARNLSKAYDKVLFQDLNVAVLRGQCVGVMGPNGSGKTTLIKTLIGHEKADRGEVKMGHRVQVGYHDQGLQSLLPSTTVVRAVWPEDDPEWVEGDVRNLLARFGLTGELVFQAVGQLSGGERAKAALARTAPRPPISWSWTSPLTTSTSGRVRLSSGRSASSRARSWSSVTIAIFSTRWPTGCSFWATNRAGHRGRLRDLSEPGPEREGCRCRESSRPVSPPCSVRIETRRPQRRLEEEIPLSQGCRSGARDQ